MNAIGNFSGKLLSFHFHMAAPKISRLKCPSGEHRFEAKVAIRIRNFSVDLFLKINCVDV